MSRDDYGNSGRWLRPAISGKSGAVQTLGRKIALVGGDLKAMREHLNFALFSLVALGACTPTPTQLVLTKGAERVMMAKSDPGDNYEIIGPVSGYDGEGCGGFGYRGSYERAATDLRNKTHDLNGDYAQIVSLTEPHMTFNCFDNEFIIRGIAYRKTSGRPPETPLLTDSGDDSARRIREMKSLYDDGIITKEEYEDQKKKYLR